MPSLAGDCPISFAGAAVPKEAVALTSSTAVTLAGIAAPNGWLAKGVAAIGLAAKALILAAGNHEADYLAFVRSVYRVFKTPGGISEWTLQGAAAVFESLANLAALFNVQALFGLADGRWLDLHAAGFGYTRRPSETDAELRARIWSPPDVTMAGLNAALAVAVAKTGLRAALVELPLAFCADSPAVLTDHGGSYCSAAGQVGANAWTSPVPPGVLLHVGPDANVTQMSAGLNSVFGAKAGGVACDLWVDANF